MAKRGRLTRDSGLHSDARGKLHKIHQRHNKQRRARRVEFHAHDIADDRDYEPFASNVSAIGAGRNWFRPVPTEMKEVGSSEWETGIAKIETDNDWFQQRQVRKGQIGYYRRKVRDRQKLGPNDKKGRALSDVDRETIDLRPDHSRVIQYLLEAGKKEEVEQLVAEIRAEKIRLFERLYHRDVVAMAEHPDAGQYHHDLWHCGIRLTKVQDDGGTESLAPLGKVEVAGGSERQVRLREPFKIFGVGVGVTSWDRHRRALVDANDDPNQIMGETLKLLRRNGESAKKQNGEPARDLKLLEALDAHVKSLLLRIDPDAVETALREYTQWIKTGYAQGKLGMMPETATVTRLKDKVNSLMQEKEGLMCEVADLRQEASNLKAHHNLIRELFSKLLRLPMVVEAIRKISQEAWELFEELVRLFELPSIAAPPRKPKLVDGTSAGEPQGLLKAGNSPNRKKPNDDMTQNI